MAAVMQLVVAHGTWYTGSLMVGNHGQLLRQLLAATIHTLIHGLLLV